MIKKSMFEDDIISGMQEKLAENYDGKKTPLEKAVDYLNSAYDIFDDCGKHAQAEAIIAVLNKIAMRDPRKISDRHTQGLSPDKQIQNLLHHGTQFNMADDGAEDIDSADSDDLLNLEIDDGLEVSDNDYFSSFEEEK